MLLLKQRMNLEINHLTYSVAFLLLMTLAGFISLSLLQTDITLATLMQIISLLTILILISTRILFPKIRQKFGTKVAYFVEGFPVILFVYLLILATGGISSPFLVLTHFLALAVAFLLSPQLAVEFIFTTMILLGIHIYFDIAAQKFVAENIFAIILYFIAYLALVPISYAIAKEYKFKEEWARLLEKEITTSQTQEEELLKNITDALIVLSRKLEIVYLNEAAKELLGFGKEILGQDLFRAFSFKDEVGRNLERHFLPFEQTMSLQVQQRLENIQILSKKGRYFRVNIKILPLIGVEGPLGLTLIIRPTAAVGKIKEKKESTAVIALEKFLAFLASEKKVFFDLEKTVSEKNKIEKLITQNEELETLAQDFIYALKLESGEIGSLWSLCDLGKIAQEVIFWEGEKARNLGVTLASNSDEEKSIPLQPKNIILQSVAAQRIFPEVYVVGNVSWIHDGLRRVLELAILLCKAGSQVEVEVKEEGDIGQVVISITTDKVQHGLELDLFEKFYGELANLPELASTSGLGGFIAKSLIDRMGGNIIADKNPTSSKLIFTITFGLKN